MADAWDFLDSILINQPDFAGRVAVISAFFDESETGDKSVFVVAGVLFDRDGLERFNAEWRKRTAGFAHPYRTADCVGGHGAFELSPWGDTTLRLQFRKGLAALIRDTYKATISVTIEPSVVAAIWAKSPATKALIPGPYSLCLVRCLHIAQQWAAKAGYDGEIEFLFESGAPGGPEAAALLARIAANPELKARFQTGLMAFGTKDKGLALAAADFIAWHSQRHHAAKPDQWIEDFEVLRSGNKGPIYSDHITHNDVGLLGLLNSVYGLTGEPPS